MVNVKAVVCTVIVFGMGSLLLYLTAYHDIIIKWIIAIVGGLMITASFAFAAYQVYRLFKNIFEE